MSGGSGDASEASGSSGSDSGGETGGQQTSDRSSGSGSQQADQSSEENDRSGSGQSSGQDDAEQDDAPQAGRSAYVLASDAGVVRRVGADDTAVTSKGARVAFGVDDLVAYERGGTGRKPATVRVWSPSGGDRQLEPGDGADGVRLLGAGALDGEPVALMRETVPAPKGSGGESRPSEVTDRLVAVGLRDGSRTVFSEGLNAFESGWISAHLLPGGDVIAVRQSEVTTTLSRLDRADGRVWRTSVAEDRSVALAALGTRLWVVGAQKAEGEATTLRIEAYAAGDGSRRASRERPLDEALPGRVACPDWYDRDRLSCQTDDGPRAVAVRGGSAGAASAAKGPAGAVLTAVATTG